MLLISEQTVARAKQPNASNSRLHAAKAAKNDEFYTQLTDIEKELRHYKDHFKGKVVFCNCDDPEWSNFWKFFTLNFDNFGLKKVVATHYASGQPSYKLEFVGADKPLLKTGLTEDGDFRSDECVAILKEADIVVTNPPFSLFREYVAQLIDHGKQFLIIGNQNALTYREIFALLQSNQIWAGVDNAGTKWFRVPQHYEIQTESRIKVVDGVKYFSMGSIYWFTNLPHYKRNEELVLYRTYHGNEHSYPRYDNFNAIEVSRVADIPVDFEGCMGVPITFLDKYNPAQFEIVRFRKGDDDRDLTIGGKPPYFRIVIKRKQYEN